MALLESRTGRLVTVAATAVALAACGGGSNAEGSRQASGTSPVRTSSSAQYGPEASATATIPLAVVRAEKAVLDDATGVIFAKTGDKEIVVINVGQDTTKRAGLILQMAGCELDKTKEPVAAPPAQITLFMRDANCIDQVGNAIAAVNQQATTKPTRSA